MLDDIRQMQSDLKVLRKAIRAETPKLIGKRALREKAEAVTACLPVEREHYASQLRSAGFVDVTITAGQPYPREASSSTPIAKELAAEDPGLAPSLEAFATSVSGVIIEGRRAG